MRGNTPHDFDSHKELAPPELELYNRDASEQSPRSVAYLLDRHDSAVEWSLQLWWWMEVLALSGAHEKIPPDSKC